MYCTSPSCPSLITCEDVILAFKALNGHISDLSAWLLHQKLSTTHWSIGAFIVEASCQAEEFI